MARAGTERRDRAQALAERLRGRRGEIEQEILVRVYAVEDPENVSNPGYVSGLRSAVSAGVSYALAGIEADDPQPGPVPGEAIAQARLAADEGVSLDTVLRRYLVGHTLFGDFLIREAEASGPLGYGVLQQILRIQSTLMDRLVAVVAEEHNRAHRGSRLTSAQRRISKVKRLLAGDLLDPTQLEYDIGLYHLGLVATGPGAEEVVRSLTEGLTQQRLLAAPNIGTVWVWLGSSGPIEMEEILKFAGTRLPDGVALAAGEIARGIVGWRLTHRQAKAALPIAVRGAGIARYTNVALLATALHDDLLAASLRSAYLTPLNSGRDGGEALRQTLRAYFAAGRNASSAAASLGVSRQAVNGRLRKVEERLGRALNVCAPELETALSLRDFDRTIDDCPALLPH